MNGRLYTDEDLAYLAMFYEIDGKHSMAAALDRTPESVAFMAYRLRQQGKWHYYRKVWHEGDINSLERG